MLGRHFKIYSDHRTLQYFLDQKITTPTQQKWLLKLAGYDYSIHFKAGKSNTGPDALSRKEELTTAETDLVTKYGSFHSLVGISSPTRCFLQEIQAACLEDSEAKVIIDQLQHDTSSQPHYKLEGNQLLFKGKIFVPQCDNWRQRIISEFHDGYNGGHAWRHRTYKRVSRSFCWIGMHQDVKNYVAECDICQRNHYEAQNPPGLLQPNAIPTQAWTCISMDFVEGLPTSGGKNVIMVVVDRFTKFGHFMALSHPYTTSQVVQLFIQGVFKLHGMPESIISD